MNPIVKVAAACGTPGPDPTGLFKFGRAGEKLIVSGTGDDVGSVGVKVAVGVGVAVTLGVGVEVAVGSAEATFTIGFTAYNAQGVPIRPAPLII